MDLRLLDIHDDDLMRAAHGVVDRGDLHGREGMPRWTLTEWVEAVRAPDSGERAEHYGVFVDGSLVGVGIVYLFLLDNTDKAWLEIVVDPDHRRRGVGSALIARLLDVAEAAGRTVICSDSNIPFEQLAEHPYRSFAEQNRFTQSNIEVVRHLSLPVEHSLLHAWADQAAEKASGYCLKTYVGPFPDELAESLCVLLGQLSVDAPTGDVDYEEEVMTPERLTERYARSVAMGRETFETVAVTPDRVVAAQSTLQVPLDGSDAFQWGTFVHRQHRGHRLGLAVKVANLQAIQAQRPHITRIVTQNGETNDYMVSINEQIGFAPVEASVEFLRRA